VDCTWETDNDTDEDTETLPDAFSGFRKGFLLGKPPDRKAPERPTKPITVPALKALAFSASHRNGRNRPKRRFYPILNHPLLYLSLLYNAMAESYADEEIRIGKACDALERIEKPNIALAARDFDVNERKLRNRFNGISSKSKYGGQNKTLIGN
jgi:hypothetical protein